MKLLLLCLPLLGLFISCNSAPSGEDAIMRVTLRRYKQGQVFELVSESHTDPKKYYSTLRADANRKVLPDRAMQSLVSGIQEAGMNEYEQEGPAPTTASAGVRSSFELQHGEHLTHWAPHANASAKEQELFFVLLNDYLKIYSQTESFQFVQNKRGGQLFVDDKMKTKR